MSDEVKAGIVTFVFIALLYAGGLIGETNKLAGAIISISAVVAFVGILYGSWMLEQRDKREKRSREIYQNGINKIAGRLEVRDREKV